MPETLTEKTIDLIGQIIWFAIPVVFIGVMWFVWKWGPDNKMMKLLLGLGLAGCAAFILFLASMQICFRNGMGP